MLNPARRNARERALELLYEAEIKKLSVDEVLRALPLAPDPFAVELVTGVARNAALIDRDISSHLRQGWSLHRLATIDRLVLRLGIEELRHNLDVPTAVVLDESVRLAKGFSSDESAKFVNGVLAAIAREVRPDASDELPDLADFEDIFGTEPSTGQGRPGTTGGASAMPSASGPGQTPDPSQGIRLEDEPPTSLDLDD